MSKSVSSNRHTFIDTFRGITIISMIAFHTCWDLVYFSLGLSSDFLRSSGAYVWQQSICYSFILISGYCYRFGKHHLKRGLMALGGGIIISIVTTLVMYDSRDLFGVLWLLGSSTLIMIPFDRIIKKTKTVSIVGLIVSLSLFIITRNINRGYLGFEGLNLLKLPEGLYRGYVMTFLGFTSPSFFSSDYFSLFPWIFLFSVGYFLGNLLRDSKFERSISGYGIKPLEAVGRHSLLIYMLHQVVIFVVVYLISFLLKG